MAIRVGVKTNFPKQLITQVLRQLPFAMKNALNDVAEAFQAEQRVHQRRVFTIRQKTYFQQAVKIARRDFARVDSLRSVVHIDPKTTAGATATERSDIFRRQEFGGRRRPRRTALALPQKAVKRTSRGLIKKAETPARLKRDFVVNFASGGRGLFRRVGRRRSPGGQRDLFSQARFGLEEDPNIEFVYFLAPGADIDAKYDFFKNASKIWRTVFSRQINRRMDEAFKSVKIRNRRK